MLIIFTKVNKSDGNIVSFAGTWSKAAFEMGLAWLFRHIWSHNDGIQQMSPDHLLG